MLHVLCVLALPGEDEVEPEREGQHQQAGKYADQQALHKIHSSVYQQFILMECVSLEFRTLILNVRIFSNFVFISRRYLKMANPKITTTVYGVHDTAESKF